MLKRSEKKKILRIEMIQKKKEEKKNEKAANAFKVECSFI